MIKTKSKTLIKEPHFLAARIKPKRTIYGRVIKPNISKKDQIKLKILHVYEQ